MPSKWFLRCRIVGGYLPGYRVCYHGSNRCMVEVDGNDDGDEKDEDDDDEDNDEHDCCCC